MKIIFKYQLNAYPTQHYIPRDARFLCVQTQRNMPQMWFVVDPEKQDDLVARNFETRPTGQTYNESREEQYLGTFQMDEGALVFHLFELL